jgi:hypothetical protein
LNVGLWLRRDRLDMFPPATRHQRRNQAGKPLIGLFRFAQPPLNADSDNLDHRRFRVAGVRGAEFLSRAVAGGNGGVVETMSDQDTI